MTAPLLSYTIFLTEPKPLRAKWRPDPRRSSSCSDRKGTRLRRNCSSSSSLPLSRWKRNLMLCQSCRRGRIHRHRSHVTATPKIPAAHTMHIMGVWIIFILNKSFFIQREYSLYRRTSTPLLSSGRNRRDVKGTVQIHCVAALDQASGGQAIASQPVCCTV